MLYRNKVVDQRNVPITRCGLPRYPDRMLDHVREEFQCSDLVGLLLPTPGLDDYLLDWEFFSALDRYCEGDLDFHTRNMPFSVLDFQFCLSTFARSGPSVHICRTFGSLLSDDNYIEYTKDVDLYILCAPGWSPHSSGLFAASCFADSGLGFPGDPPVAFVHCRLLLLVLQT